jgi:hypothetical protein
MRYLRLRTGSKLSRVRALALVLAAVAAAQAQPEQYREPFSDKHL